MTTGKPNPLATCLFPPLQSSPWEDRGLQDSWGTSRMPCVWRGEGEGQAAGVVLAQEALVPAAPCLPHST